MEKSIRSQPQTDNRDGLNDIISNSNSSNKTSKPQLSVDDAVILCQHFITKYILSVSKVH